MNLSDRAKADKTAKAIFKQAIRKSEDSDSTSEFAEFAIYADGFTIGTGFDVKFRPFAEPENAAFMKQLKAGQLPIELEPEVLAQLGQGVKEVKVKLSERTTITFEEAVASNYMPKQPAKPVTPVASSTGSSSSSSTGDRTAVAAVASGGDVEYEKETEKVQEKDTEQDDQEKEQREEVVVGEEEGNADSQTGSSGNDREQQQQQQKEEEQKQKRNNSPADALLLSLASVADAANQPDPLPENVLVVCCRGLPPIVPKQFTLVSEQPLCELSVVTYPRQRQTLVFNTTTTLKEVYQHILWITRQSKFGLFIGYPPMLLSDFPATLDQVALHGASVVQRVPWQWPKGVAPPT
mmetsp:Transcript_32277/g.63126  ORF Transcript_32277/g.63126 Transcript_32277/m.63126 type:complete len:351 (+) Transcript_32277:60-1112(+)